MVDIRALALLTVQQPRKAAAQLLALRLDRNTLWLGLGLAAVLNTLLFMLSSALFPAPTPLPALFTAPLLYAVVMAGGLVLMALILTALGRAMGGAAGLEDMLVLMIWLQFLRLAAQVALLVLATIVPGLALPLTIAAGLFGLWIFLHFLDVAQGFSSLGKAFALLGLAFLGIVFGLSILLALLGVTTMGVA